MGRNSIFSGLGLHMSGSPLHRYIRAQLYGTLAEFEYARPHHPFPLRKNLWRSFRRLGLFVSDFPDSCSGRYSGPRDPQVGRDNRLTRLVYHIFDSVSARSAPKYLGYYSVLPLISHKKAIIFLNNYFNYTLPQQSPEGLDERVN